MKKANTINSQQNKYIQTRPTKSTRWASWARILWALGLSKVEQARPRVGWRAPARRRTGRRRRRRRA
uniref:Uncharacterized protein n=1 Tax=Oryza brachyantha TaxID=4533 RepID=J3KYI4_ORYBR